jgi:hypothetical protein
MNPAIEQLHRDLAELADPEIDPEYHARLATAEVAGRLYLDFWGSPFDEPFAALCAALVRPEVASSVALLSLRSPIDIGANGTRNWDLSALAEAGVVYSSLRSLTVEQAGPGDHNRPIVAASYDEEGVVGRLLSRAPQLEVLVVPSAPDGTFFEQSSHPLRYLSVDAGYDAQGFIGNLADATCFPHLRTLEFGEFNETYLEDFPASCTPFEEYRRLFSSQAFRGVRAFVWRNPVASDTEMAELRSLRPEKDLQIKIVQYSSRYL